MNTTMKRFERFVADIPPLWLNLVVGLVGAIMILLAVCLPSNWSVFNGVLIGVGTSLVASAVVAYLTSRYVRNEANMLSLVEAWGLHGLYRTRAEMNPEVNPLLLNADSIDIAAFGLRSLRDSQGDVVRQRISKGMRVRILTPHPESTFVRERTKSEKGNSGQIKSEIESLIEWCRDVRSSAMTKDQVQLRTYHALPLDFYFRVNSVVFLGPYIHGRTSQQTFSYSFEEPGKGFTEWTRYFEELWDDIGFCTDVLEDQK